MAEKKQIHPAWSLSMAVILAFLSGAMIGSGFLLGVIYIPLSVVMLGLGLSKFSHTEVRASHTEDR